MFSYFSKGSSSPEAPPSERTPPPETTIQPTPTQQDKRLKRNPPPPNLKLLVGGVTFFAMSLFVTRRALRKRLIASIPPYYTSATYHKPEANGALDAFEALTLATMNVFSFGMASTGAVMYKFDVNSLEDARGVMRRVYAARGGGVGAAGGDRSGNAKEDELAEEEIEAWVVKTFGLKGYEEKKKEIVRQRAEEEEKKKGNGNGSE